MVTREGSIVDERDWGVSDRMLDDDGSLLTHKSEDQMLNRNKLKPLYGERRNAA